MLSSAPFFLGFSCWCQQRLTCTIRWCCNAWSIYKYQREASVFCGIFAKCWANSLWQTGWRFMYTLASSYGVTRRGMTQSLSASLLALDRWSRPNATVLSLIPHKIVWTLYTFSIDSGDLLEMSKMSPSPFLLRLMLLRRGLQWPLSLAWSDAKDLWSQNIIDVCKIYVLVTHLCPERTLSSDYIQFNYN